MGLRAPKFSLENAHPSAGRTVNKYRVSYAVSGGKTGKPLDIDASDENEAWAIYCDKVQSWPSPQHRIIEKLGK